MLICLHTPPPWPFKALEACKSYNNFQLTNEESETLNYLLGMVEPRLQSSPADTRAYSPNHWVFCIWPTRGFLGLLQCLHMEANIQRLLSSPNLQSPTLSLTAPTQGSTGVPMRTYTIQWQSLFLEYYSLALYPDTPHPHKWNLLKPSISKKIFLCMHSADCKDSLFYPIFLVKYSVLLCHSKWIQFCNFFDRKVLDWEVTSVVKIWQHNNLS